MSLRRFKIRTKLSGGIKDAHFKLYFRKAKEKKKQKKGKKKIESTCALVNIIWTIK
jgi:hypothetical protein